MATGIGCGPTGVGLLEDIVAILVRSGSGYSRSREGGWRRGVESMSKRQLLMSPGRVISVDDGNASCKRCSNLNTIASYRGPRSHSTEREGVKKTRQV